MEPAEAELQNWLLEEVGEGGWDLPPPVTSTLPTNAMKSSLGPSTGRRALYLVQVGA